MTRAPQSDFPSVPASFAEAQRPAKVADALEKLGRRIASGSIAEGETLPIEPELATELNVSRSTVREVVRTLIALGMVEVRPRIGTRVRPSGEWNLLNRDVLRWMSPEDAPNPVILAAIGEARHVFEPSAAALAAERATDSEIARIRVAFDAMQVAADRASIVEAIQADRAFHLAVLEATHNPILRAFDSAIDAILGVLFRVTTNHLEDFRDNLGNHRRVLDAIAAHDPEAARQAMADTIGHTEDHLRHSDIGPGTRT